MDSIEIFFAGYRRKQEKYSWSYIYHSTKMPARDTEIIAPNP
nr:hypothetical protein [uncultured Blautia sp.]